MIGRQEDCYVLLKMKGESSYVPPRYIPLDQSDLETESVPRNEEHSGAASVVGDGPAQWSSGVCACCDDMQSCTLTFSAL